jgi:hypothetical protein
MTYKQIETSREIRLWIGQIIVPAVTAVATVMYMNPELRTKAKTTFENVKENIKAKFNK